MHILPSDTAATRTDMLQRIQSMVVSSLGPCRFGHWLRYENHVGHIECFRKGGPTAGRRVLVVQVWSKGSEVDYFVGSHRHKLEAVNGKRSLHEVERSELERYNCKPEEKVFESGAM